MLIILTRIVEELVRHQVVQSRLVQFARDPFHPPSVKQCAAAVGRDVFTMLVECGTLWQVSDEVVFLEET